MTITAFKDRLRNTSLSIDFQETMTLIENHYTFTPTTFSNGDVTNEAGSNSGSCKVFAFAKIQGLTKEETLACFGQYYTDVLNTPDGDNHQNIRNFMKTGFEGLIFKGAALKEK